MRPFSFDVQSALRPDLLIKGKKMSILALNYTFGGQSRNLGSSENEAVFFRRTVCIEAGSVNKRGENGVD